MQKRWEWGGKQEESKGGRESGEREIIFNLHLGRGDSHKRFQFQYQAAIVEKLEASVQPVVPGVMSGHAYWGGI